MHSSSLIIIVLLVGFSLYRRVRRTVGFQRLHKRQMGFRAGLFIFIGLVVLALGYVHPIVYVADVAGIVIGLALAFTALSTTRFEHRSGGWYYRPSPWIGAIVLAVFFIRLIYRFLLVYEMQKSVHQGAGSASMQTSAYVTDPWTAGAFFILFAYYAYYNIALIRRERHLDAQLSSDVPGAARS